MTCDNSLITYVESDRAFSDRGSKKEKLFLCGDLDLAFGPRGNTFGCSFEDEKGYLSSSTYSCTENGHIIHEGFHTR